ncbi:histidine kinase [Lactobacillus sp. CBA3606]|uniref:sensor histidine kinase n=1 Tax=Lactobacillus sp. CBA3606 TaxID=2099789 RepID=UPI000CFB6FB3|nr:GHKL domain-containing protein [Lactobacillus sp. CBA3606]AVK63646.1 histidine kinase [Lactobacillus sp. CBA3606]
MALLFYSLSLISGYYEMIILSLTFREYFTWKLGLTWAGLITLCNLFGQVATAQWPQVPLVFFWILPITLANMIMSARLLYTKWILMLPIVLFLNAFKRLIGGLSGSFLKWLTSSDVQMRLRQIVDLNLTANLNIFGAMLIGLPIVIIIGFIAHHWVIKMAATDFFQHAQIDRNDYLLVLLFYALYILAYDYALNLSVVLQTYVAVASSIIFGIISFYLVSSKNSRLTDAQLLSEVSNYNQLLSNRNQQLHLFKHDYQNILLSLSQYIQSDDMTGLKTYFEAEVLHGDQSLPVDGGPEQLRRLHIPALSGLIYAKYELAASRHVTLQLTILQTIQAPEFEQVRLVRILGNLLDNAIDAATHVDGQVQVTIERTTQGDLQFNIQNKIPAGDTINLHRIKKSRFTTKPGHLGYGLSSIEQLAGKQVNVTYQINDAHFLAQLTVQPATALRKS